MNKKPKPVVSIVVTTKNEESNISRLLGSITEQTYKKIEIIIVDNNSSDKTKKLARKYTDKVFNKGPERSVQRNYGVKKASGEYVMILDADMELTSGVVESCVTKIVKTGAKALVIPERTTGKGFIATVRRFERDMYYGDTSVEVARFFDRKIFEEFGGYDSRLTGPEDYDLPYRISKKYKIDRINKYIFHHEGNLTLSKLLRKRFYYANMGAFYARKHPELILRQGILIFRVAYLRHWRKFFKHPLIGMAFLAVRLLETFSAGIGFVKTLVKHD